MGGLYSSRTALEEEKIPILSDLPFIGELFKGKNATKEVTQLIFFLKVHIIPAEKDQSGILYNPYSSAKNSELYGDLLQNAKSNPSHESAVRTLLKDMGNAVPGKKVKDREKFMKNLSRALEKKDTKVSAPQKTESKAVPAPAKAKENKANNAVLQKKNADKAAAK